MVQRSIAALDFSVAFMVLHKEGPSMNDKENLVWLLTRGDAAGEEGGGGVFNRLPFGHGIVLVRIIT